MKTPLAIAGVLLSSALAFAACSNDDDAAAPISIPSGGTSGSTSSGGSSGTADAGADDQSCSSLPQTGATVEIVVAKPPKPDPSGGAPADGTYVLTSVRAFTDIFPEGRTIQTFGAYTLVVGDGATTFEQVVTNKDGEISRARGALVADGTSFKATPSCQTPLVDGGVTVLDGQYTADATALRMYVVRDLGITAELKFEKK